MRACSDFCNQFKLCYNCYVQQIADSMSKELGTHDGPANNVTHNVTGQYSLIVKDADVADEGQYQCSLNAGGIEAKNMYLIVSGGSARGE